MVRGTDEHGINVPSREKFPEIAVGTAVLVLVAVIDLFARLPGVVLPHITNREHLGVRLSQDPIHVPPALRSATDECNANSIAGCHRSVLAESRSRQDVREHGPGDGRARHVA